MVICGKSQCNFQMSVTQLSLTLSQCYRVASSPDAAESVAGGTVFAKIALFIIETCFIFISSSYNNGSSKMKLKSHHELRKSYGKNFFTMKFGIFSDTIFPSLFQTE